MERSSVGGFVGDARRDHLCEPTNIDRTEKSRLTLLCEPCLDAISDKNFNRKNYPERNSYGPTAFLSDINIFTLVKNFRFKCYQNISEQFLNELRSKRKY